MSIDTDGPAGILKIHSFPTGGNVLLSGGKGVPEWWKRIFRRWKYTTLAVEMVSRSGGKMKKIEYIGVSSRFYRVLSTYSAVINQHVLHITCPTRGGFCFKRSLDTNVGEQFARKI